MTRTFRDGTLGSIFILSTGTFCDPIFSHGPEGGWTFDLRDNPWLQGTPSGGRYRIDHVLPALSPEFSRSWRVDYAGRFGLEEHDGVVASDLYGIFADLELTDPF
jgi:hypothetical protein